MDNEHVILFPICIKNHRDSLKMYIPAIDMETRAKSYLEALSKARQLLMASMVIDEVDESMVMKETCPIERVLEYLKEKEVDDYTDARIVFVDCDTKSFDSSKPGEVKLQLPQYLINDLNSENIDCTGILKNVAEEVVRRKRLFNEINDWNEKTAEIILRSGRKHYGRIKSIRYDKESPWNFTIRLQTGLSDSIIIESSAIEEINEVPVVINKLGTFHLVNQEGMISIMGELWWRNRHIDVYLEYDSSKEVEDQEIFDLLKRYNKTKYEFDDAVRPIIAKKLINQVDVLFKDYSEDDPLKKKDYILEQLINRIELWFIDISSDNTVYMDYNFSNGVGKLSVGVTKNPDDSFTIKFNGASVYEDEEEDKPAEE